MSDTRPPWETDNEPAPWEVDDSVVQPLSGATEIKPQPPLWKRALEGGKGFMNELAMIPMRGAELGREVLAGETPWDPATQVERAKRMKAIEEALGASEASGLPESRPSRILARMVPGAVAAAATGGMSLPAQAAIQGGVQGLQSLSEGADPETAAIGAGIAGLGPVAGKAVNAGMSVAKAPFKGKVDQELLAALERLNAGAAKTGGAPIELPAGAITNSEVARGADQMAARMIGGGKIEERGLKAMDDISTMAGRQGAGADPMVAGRGVAGDVAAARQGLQTAKNIEYGKVGDLTGIPGVPQGTLDEIDRMLAQGTAAPDVLERLRALREAIAPKTAESAVDLGKYADDPNMAALIQKQLGAEAPAPTPRSVADLMSQQAGLEYGGPNALSDAALSNRLRESLGGDVNRILGEAAPDQLGQLNTAKAAYGKYADLSKSRLGKTASAYAESNQFDKIPDALLRSSESAADIGRLMKTVTPETQDQLREVLLRKIVGNAENLTPKQIERGLYTYGKVAKEVLTPEQFQILSDLAIVRKGLGKTTIGSPTTPLLQAREYLKSPVRMAALLGAGAIGAREDGGVGAAAGVGGTLGAEALIAMLLGGKGGQRWLTTGLGRASLPGSLVRGGSVAASRIPSEVELAKRRRGLEDSLARR